MYKSTDLGNEKICIIINEITVALASWFHTEEVQAKDTSIQEFSGGIDALKSVPSVATAATVVATKATKAVTQAVAVGTETAVEVATSAVKTVSKTAFTTVGKVLGATVGGVFIVVDIGNIVYSSVQLAKGSISEAAEQLTQLTNDLENELKEVDKKLSLLL